MPGPSTKKATAEEVPEDVSMADAASEQPEAQDENEAPEQEDGEEGPERTEGDRTMPPHLGKKGPKRVRIVSDEVYLATCVIEG